MKLNVTSEEYKVKQKRNSKFLKQLRKNYTRAEELLGKYLIQREIYFIFQKGFLRPFHRIVDFYLPMRGVIIEVDGGYHDFTKKKDDYKDTRWRKERSLVTVRITNEEVYRGEFSKVDKYISRPLEVDCRNSRCPKKWKLT